MAGQLTTYVEITLIPDGIATLNDVWRVVFRQVHKALADANNAGLGVSFPAYRYEPKYKTLGDKLRVFASSESELMALNLNDALSYASEYCHVSKVRKVPEKVSYACFGRKRYRNNYEKLVKGKMVHLGVSEEEAKTLIGEFKPKKTDLPYIHYQSISSMNAGKSADIMLAIQKIDMDHSIISPFNLFGLSNTATVPVF